jgi:hypothetical protein
MQPAVRPGQLTLCNHISEMAFHHGIYLSRKDLLSREPSHERLSSYIAAKPTATLVLLRWNNRCKGRPCTTNQAEDKCLCEYLFKVLIRGRKEQWRHDIWRFSLQIVAVTKVASFEPAYSPQ